MMLFVFVLSSLYSASAEEYCTQAISHEGVVQCLPLNLTQTLMLTVDCNLTNTKVDFSNLVKAEYIGLLNCRGEVHLPNLVEVNQEVAVYTSDFTVLDLPKLRRGGIVAQEMLKLQRVNLPVLQSCGGVMSSFFSFKQLPALTEISAPNLETTVISGLEVSMCQSIKTVSFPKLTIIDYGFLAMSYNEQLTSISLPKLKDVGTSIAIQTNPKLVKIELPALRTVHRAAYKYMAFNITAPAPTACVELKCLDEYDAFEVECNGAVHTAPPLCSKPPYSWPCAC